jgi:hypothetical protein
MGNLENVPLLPFQNAHSSQQTPIHLPKTTHNAPIWKTLFASYSCGFSLPPCPFLLANSPSPLPPHLTLHPSSPTPIFLFPTPPSPRPIPPPAFAQITPDGTVGITVTGSPNFIIDGGTRPNNGPNLFHSFSQFSVPTGGSAIFKNAADVVNILSCVIGGTL